MSLDLDAIEQRANAATPGPWTAVPDQTHGFYGDDHYDIQARDDNLTVAMGGYVEDGGPALGACDREDAEFIAHAREDVPALVAEAKRLREDNAALVASKSDDWQTGYDTGCAMSHSIGCGAAQDHRDSLLAAVERVRALHAERPNDWWSDGDRVTDRWKPTECALCICPWPCPTIRTLDGAT